MWLTSVNEWLENKTIETYLTRLQVAGSLKIYIYQLFCIEYRLPLGLNFSP